ncbi:MAG: hypothetical protein JNL32_07290 [Candidatus Kapabacteria bacterium]|nr:hypothetical protein [Candidatus Kapabacteria bacterium]
MKYTLCFTTMLIHLICICNIILYGQNHWKLKQSDNNAYRSYAPKTIAKIGKRLLVGGSFSRLTVGSNDSTFPSIRYSDDNGESWTDALINDWISVSTFSGGSVDVFEIHSTDSLNAYAFCNSRIYRTTNSGTVWDTSFMTPRYSSRYGSFFNAKYGAAGSLYQCLIRYTNDSGKTWKNILNKALDGASSRNGEYRAYCTDSTTVLVTYKNPWGNQITPSTRYYRTTNAGASWDSLGCTISGFEGDSSNNIYLFGDAHFSSSMVGYQTVLMKIDTHYYTGVIRTDNGGLRWHIIDSVKIEDTEYSITELLQVFGTDTIFVVYRNAWVRVSIDGGITWRWLVKKDIELANQVKVRNVQAVYSHSPTDAILNTYTNWFTLESDTVTSVEPEAPTRLNYVATVWVSSVSPIPITDRMNVRLFLSESSVRSAVGLRLFSIMGEPVSDYSSALTGYGSGWNTVPVNVSGLPNGVYILQLRDAEQQHSIPVIISR